MLIIFYASIGPLILLIFFGMLVFGYLSDKMGRKFGMVSARTTFAV